MKVTVLLFGPVADAAGADRVELEIGAKAHAEAVLRALGREHPAVAPLLSSAVLAVNGSYVGPEGPVSEGDEVAVIPPVSGG